MKELILTEQTCKNLRYYDTAPPGQAITGAYINHTLGLAAKLCAEVGKEVAGSAWTLREVKKKCEGK